MLSFFSKKKQSPDTPTEDIIPGPQNPEQNNGDDFIFIEKRQPAAPPPAGGGVYPPMPPAPFGLPYPPLHPAQIGGGGGGIGPGNIGGGATSSMDSLSTLPYIQGVPFELAPQLSSKTDFDLIQMQVDGILALLTRQLSVDETNDYNFTLERSIQDQ